MNTLEKRGLIAKTVERRGKEPAEWVLTTTGQKIHALLLEQPDLGQKRQRRGDNAVIPVTVEETKEAADLTRTVLRRLCIPHALAYAEDELLRRLQPSVFNAFLSGQREDAVLETFQQRINDFLPLVRHAQKRPSVYELLGLERDGEEPDGETDFYRRGVDIAEAMERIEDGYPDDGEDDLADDDLETTEFDDQGKPIPRERPLPVEQAVEEEEPVPDDDQDNPLKNTERKRIVEARRGERGAQLRRQQIFVEARRIFGVVSKDRSSRMVQAGKEAVRRYLAINRINGDDSECFLAELSGEAVTDANAPVGSSRKQDDAEKVRTWRRALREFQKHHDPCALLALEEAPDTTLRTRFQCSGNDLSRIHAALATIGVRRLSSGEFARDRAYFVRTLHTALQTGNAHVFLQFRGVTDAWLQENPRVTDDAIRAVNTALRSIGYRRMEDGKIQRLPPSKMLRRRRISRSTRKGAGEDSSGTREGKLELRPMACHEEAEPTT